MFTRKRAVDAAAAQALAERVHGTRRTCVDCGAAAACDPDAVEFRTPGSQVSSCCCTRHPEHLAGAPGRAP